VLFFSFAIGMTNPIDGFSGFSVLQNGDNVVKIYFVLVDGVSSFHGYNMSRLLEGVLDAARNRTAKVYLDLAPDAVFDFIETIVKVNSTVSVVQDWGTYEDLVESGYNIMIINAHDQYLPVPEGYTKEQWVDKIADAMLNRYVIWAHVGGYPFFNVWHQDGSKEEWGAGGLQRLMEHIAEYGITCWQHPDTTLLATMAAMHVNYTWRLQDIIDVNLGYSYPLDISQYSHTENIDYPYIYGLGNYRPGAILRFRKDNMSDFGLYLHVTPTKFYNAAIQKTEIDEEFARGYAATAWALYYQFCGPQIDMYWTEKWIRTNRKIGNTYGLDQAEQLLQEARDAYSEGNYLKSLARSRNAYMYAKNATQPPPSIILYSLIFGTLGIGSGTVTYVVIHRKRKEDKNNSRRSSSWPLTG